MTIDPWIYIIEQQKGASPCPLQIVIPRSGRADYKFLKFGASALYFHANLEARQRAFIVVSLKKKSDLFPLK